MLPAETRLRSPGSKKRRKKFPRYAHRRHAKGAQRRSWKNSHPIRVRRRRTATRKSSRDIVRCCTRSANKWGFAPPWITGGMEGNSTATASRRTGDTATATRRAAFRRARPVQFPLPTSTSCSCTRTAPVSTRFRPSPRRQTSRCSLRESLRCPLGGAPSGTPLLLSRRRARTRPRRRRSL